MVGLACAGGAVEGAIYEIGVLCALEEAIDGLDLSRLDVYVGVSSGALVVSCLANEISIRAMSRAILSKEDPVLNIEPDVLFMPAFAEYAKRLKKVPGAVWNMLEAYFSKPLDLSALGMLATLAPVMPAGLFDNGSLQRYLARAFADEGRSDDFRELNTILRVVATHLDTAEIVCFGEPDNDHVAISKAVQASTALPGLYCPVEIDGEYYIDGVARRTVHASMALDAGTELLFCVNPIVPVQVGRAPHRRGAPRSLVEQGLPSVLSQTFRTMVSSRMITGFKRYEHLYPDADIILIEPDFEAYEQFFSNVFSFSNRHDVCEHAYQSTRVFLRSKADRIAEQLARHGMQLRMDVLDDRERTLYGNLPSRSVPPFGKMQRTLERLDAVLDDLEGTVGADAAPYGGEHGYVPAGITQTAA